MAEMLEVIAAVVGRIRARSISDFPLGLRRESIPLTPIYTVALVVGGCPAFCSLAGAIANVAAVFSYPET